MRYPSSKEIYQLAYIKYKKYFIIYISFVISKNDKR
jgi:hypothetical protein